MLSAFEDGFRENICNGSVYNSQQFTFCTFILKFVRSLARKMDVPVVI